MALIAPDVALVPPDAPPRVRAAPRRGVDAALVAAPALVALGLCLYQITGRSLGFDEAASVAIASQHGAALASAIAHDGGNMSGYYLFLHVLIRLFGDGELVLRLPSALAAMVTGAVVSGIALRLFDRRVAFGAGLLTAVSLPLVFWGQSARSYSILVALSAGSFLALTLLLDGSRPRRAWVVYVLCTTLAIYSSLMAILIIPAQLVVVLAWHRERARSLAWAVVAVAACCSPLAVLAPRRGAGQLFWVPRPNLVAVKQVVEAITSSGLQPTIRPTATTEILFAATLALLLLAAGAIVRRTDKWKPALVLVWLVVPVALAFVESLFGQPLFVPRNLLMVLPAGAILLAWVITRSSVPPVLSWSALTTLLVLRALQVAPAYGVSPENSQGATAYVLAHSRGGDCVAFYPSDGRQGFDYYLGSKARGDAPRPVLPAAPFSEVRPYDEDYATLSPGALTSTLSGCSRLWFISSHQGRPEGPRASQVNWARYLTLRSELAGEYRAERVKEFGYASAVQVILFSGAERH